ncbi:MAG: restriction endonuclease subunit S [Clostridia bacterium]|nr:restriction endonuclease subunit S [Clostridia bacterium]
MRTEYELGELLEYEQPTKYAVESTKYDDKYSTPVLTAGKSFILGYTNETNGIYDNLPVIIFDDFTTATQYVNFKFKVKSSAMKILKSDEKLALTKYLYYLMQTIHCDHDTHKRYWIQTYSKIKVSIPSLAEQQRILDKIEELFSKLDKGVEELNKTKEQLKIYRQAVLKEAFEGNFLLPKRIPQYDLLEKFIEKPRYGTSKKCSYENDNSTPVYRIPNINIQDNTINQEDLKFAKFDESEFESLVLQEGDVLIIRSNGSVSLVGRAAIIRKQDLSGLFAGYLMRLRICDFSKINPKYLIHFLNSHEARTYIEQTAKSTSGVNNINSSEICALKVPIFTLDEQNAIIREIESRLSVCEKVEQTVNESLQKAESLRQSILKQAFEGKLV